MPVLLERNLIADLLDSDQPPTWTALRETAKARLETQELPTTQSEDWKYCDLSPLKAPTFFPGALEAVDIKEHILPEARGTRLVFVNGCFDPHHSCVGSLPPGVRFMHLSAVTEAASQLGSLALVEANDAFANLNTARFRDGALVFIPSNTKVEAPLHVLFLSRANKDHPTFSLPRLLIVLERGAELELIEEYQGEGTTFTNAVVEVLVHDNAELRHERVQRESLEGFHVSNLRVHVERNGRYRCRTISLGARLSRQNPQVLLAGEGAEITLDGLALLSNTQLADTHSLITHAKPHGVSRQLHKCIADDQARAVFNGRILVSKGAQVTDARQESRNLLLSQSARVDAKPQLEIFADDVKCSHGATVGQLDADELFYLQSRGLSSQAARNLLIYGFASDLIGHIPVASLRRQLRQSVMDRTQASSTLGGMA